MNRGEVSKFLVLKKKFFLYGPGLTVNDFSLGIYYMLAVSSLATYGILLAGFPFFSTYLHTKNIKIGHIGETYSTARGRSLRSLFMKSTSYRTRKLSACSLPFALYTGVWTGDVGQRKCFIHTYQYNNSNKSNMNKEEFIQYLFKDRIAPVIPFDRNLIKGSCLNYADEAYKAKFLKEWGSEVGIYLIEYKYYPNIYYIGRTNQIKKRLYEHSKAESNSKFHLFLRLTGIEQFNIHILEVCAETKLGERETYYLQKYIPILNSVFSSSITEGVIKQTLLLKLKDLRAINRGKDSKSILVYVYN
jgi:hypothetical protein